ncbi:MAG TPA: hypothetical protein VJT49_23685 [Amycolatopsis sp.]|uniref:hypothetical protein n=1 Tax=Amycolatopsis sp. TaxID=37632 RepID=UPI002B486F49|nr:hypothetical protein [Amycolatopsis sp.]HKS48056.1 hypothetical protein [Amycolatopsis sp.]
MIDDGGDPIMWADRVRVSRKTLEAPTGDNREALLVGVDRVRVSRKTLEAA